MRFNVLRRHSCVLPVGLLLFFAHLCAQRCFAEQNAQLARLPAFEDEVPAPPAVEPRTEDVVEKSLKEVVAPPWYTYDVFFDSETWDSSFEIGINGTTGNSDSMSFRTGADTKHKTDGHTLSLNATYARTNSDGVETQHNALMTVRNDWDLFLDSLWSLFLKQTTEYDEFKAFDVRVAANGGLG